MRVGYFAGGDALGVIDAIKRAEDSGFDDAWMGDHFVSWFPEKMFGETWSVLSAAAAVTKKIRLGTGVTDPFRRSPVLIAQSAATLDRISGGRGVLGIGGGEPMNLLPFGIQWEKPISRMKETILIVKQLWNSSYLNALNYTGKFTRFDNAFLQIKPVRSSMPIYLGGSGPKIRRLVGEVADGWFAYVHSSETYAEDVKDVFNSARKAGRKASEIDTVAFFHCAVGNDPDAAREIVALPAAIALILSGDKLRRLGYNMDLPKELSLSRMIIKKPDLEKMHQFAKAIPSEAIDRVAAFGTPDQIVARIERYAKAGAKNVVFSILGDDLTGSFDLFAKQIIPHIRSI